jgi:hypothetical protein
MRVPDYQINAWKGRKFLRRPLRVAAGNDYSGFRITAARAADGSARILLGCGGDTTGIQHDKACILRGISRFHAMFLELALYSGAISLRGAAAEIFYVKTGHRTILAYAHLWMRDLRQL